ncbi:MAG: ATPase [Hyphomicrobiales bacterium]|nr:ATPase [Hyphomicrobiales bacterium]
MRDIFADIFEKQPLDPSEAARRSMRPKLSRRFYQAVTVEPQAGGHAVLLDGRAVRTPARRVLAAPTAALAQAIAAEWRAQREVIDPATMPLTRLANSIIDGVAEAPAPVRAEVERFLASDLICYRAGGPAGLVARQSQHWDPLLAWMRDALGARFVLAEGVMFAAQPAQALAAAARAIPDDPWRLGAVHAVTTLTGSALIALALAQGRLSTEQAWVAAHVDEDWNMAQWGEDALALERRAAREAEMQAAALVMRHLAD